VGRTSGVMPASYRLKWQRWDSYRVTPDGWLHPNGALVGSYDVFGAKALPSDLARVNRSWRQRELSWIPSSVGQLSTHDPVVRALLQFMTTYGSLGHTELEGRGRAVSIDGRRNIVSGDPLSWALAHARKVDLILSLVGALQHGANKRLRRLLIAVADRQEPRPGVRGPHKDHDPLGRNWEMFVPTTAAPWKVPLELKVRDTLERYGATVAARRLVVGLIRPNLSGVPRDIDPKTAHSVFRFTAPVQVVYWALADGLDGGRGLRKCQECQVWFFLRDMRERFCPPPPGVRESRCGRLARQTRYRRKGSSARNPGGPPPGQGAVVDALHRRLKTLNPSLNSESRRPLSASAGE
jgi:hypothetical protein